MAIHKASIIGALTKVQDPGTGQGLVASGRLRAVDVTASDEVKLEVVVPNNLAPAQRFELQASILAALKPLLGDKEPHIQFAVEGKSSKKSPIPQVKNIIAIASGKGGVGKSTVSVNLALALKKKGLRVGILDADIWGPSIPTMLQLHGQKPVVEKLYGVPKIKPIDYQGVPVMSCGFVVGREQAVVLRGPRLGGLIKQFLAECLWPELDYLIVDLPPGTGDVQLTLVQTVPLTGAIMVTTPQQLSIDDALKAMNMFLLDNVNVPVLGVVENMSWFTPAEFPDHTYRLFGEGGGAALAKMGNTELLGQLPLVQAVQQAGDAGEPIMMRDEHPSQDMFMDLATAVEQAVDRRRAIKAPTEIVEVK